MMSYMSPPREREKRDREEREGQGRREFIDNYDDLLFYPLVTFFFSHIETMGEGRGWVIMKGSV